MEQKLECLQNRNVEKILCDKIYSQCHIACIVSIRCSWSVQSFGYRAKCEKVKFLVAKSGASQSGIVQLSYKILACPEPTVDQVCVAEPGKYLAEPTLMRSVQLC